MERYEHILAGNVKVASRLIRDIEDDIPDAAEVLKRLYPHTGKALVLGITGSPGAGKSTLTDGLIKSFRQKQKTVGVLAVDPTSPFTGGAILGDRVRMQGHALDQDVFVRSLATRGALGGLSKAVGDAVHVMDSMGKDVIIIETVGAGQQEVDIMNHAHTVMVVLVPGMGDAVQTIKAGIMEIADIFVVNKAHRNGAEHLCQEIEIMLDMAISDEKRWRAPVIKVENVNEEKVFAQGVENLVEEILSHQEYMLREGHMKERLQRKSEYELRMALEACILKPIISDLVKRGDFVRMVTATIDRTNDPYTLAREIAQRYLKNIDC